MMLKEAFICTMSPSEEEKEPVQIDHCTVW